MITVDFIKPFITLWKIPSLRSLTMPPDSNDSDVVEEQFVANGETERETKTAAVISSPYIFNEILSHHYMRMLSMSIMRTTSTNNPFVALERFLWELLIANLITSHHLNDQCVSLLREEWPVETLNGLSNMLKHLVDKNTSSKTIDKESFMFMEMMSELSRDMDTF